MTSTSVAGAVQEEKEPLQADTLLSKKTPGPSPSAASAGHEHHTSEQHRALAVFKYLLVFVAALESFAHGANDTANATGLHGAHSSAFEPADVPADVQHLALQASSVRMQVPSALSGQLTTTASSRAASGPPRSGSWL